MKTLIINGSNYKSGNSIALLKQFKKYLQSEKDEINIYFDKIPYSINNNKHYIQGIYENRNNIIYNKEYDNILISSPIYKGNITPGLIELAIKLDKDIRRYKLDKKKGILLLSGYNNVCPFLSIETSKIIFENLNATLDLEDIVVSLNSEIIPANKDGFSHQKIKQITKKLNK